jgi:hypothetical protein
LILGLLLLATAGCGVGADTATPRCSGLERLGLVAQSVPTAAYVSCLRTLPEGWRTTGFSASRGTSRFTLLSDRSRGHAVEVVLTARCDTARASVAAPRLEGVRSYVRLTSISPLYAGVLYDVFPGGCVQTSFAFPRGPHIPLMEELSSAIGLVARSDLRRELRARLGVELDP